jgi:mono/diheme cytochrome c family protein
LSKQRIPRRHDTGRALGALALILNVAACGGGGAEPEAGARIAETRSTITSVRSPGGTAVTAAAAATNTEGRLLASNCAQCHGTQGRSGFGEIRDSDASELTEFATKNPSRNIMAAHAQGYTPEQLQTIAAYLRQ